MKTHHTSQTDTQKPLAKHSIFSRIVKLIRVLFISTTYLKSSYRLLSLNRQTQAKLSPDKDINAQQNRNVYERYGRLPQALVLFKMLALLFCTSQTVYAQNQILQAQKIDHQIILDGKVTEQEWANVEIIPLSQKVPNAGDPPTQKTEIRLAYDEDYLYLSGRMFDSEVDKIVANSKKRDDFTENSEWCGLLIDSYNDRENALAFFVTPTASKLDMALANDIQGLGAFNLSWNAYWDAAVTRTEEGWFAEMRIPWTTLPFEEKEGKVIMGITTWRYLARNDETDIFPPRDLSTGSSFRPSLTQRFEFSAINSKNPIHITPYILGGMARTTEYIPNPESYHTQTAIKKEVGLDAKIALSSNATLDVSLNTDFAQVEADDQQINLSRLNIFFPEKRLFFQERAGLFDFNFGSYDKLFHSRRIGIVNGAQTRIFGGLRAVGKFGNWESGFLSMQTAAHEELGSENFTVFRLRKRVWNENSNIGLIYTNRADFKGDFNSVYGLDANIRFLPQNFLSFRWAQSFTDGQENKLNSLDASKFYVEVAKRSQKGFTYNVNYGRSGKEFVPGIGFEHRHDFQKLAANLSYNMFPSRESKIVQSGPYILADLTWGNENRILESRFIHLGYNVLSKSGYSFDLLLQADAEELLYELPLTHDIALERGKYQFNSLHASVSSPSSQGFSYFASLSSGGFYHGKKSTILFAPAVNITPDLILEGNYEYNLLHFPSEAAAIHVQLSRLKFLYTFSTKLSLSAQLQHNNVSKSYLASLRLRFNPKEGNDFYLVYNGGLNQQTDRRSPWLAMSSTQTIFLKYSHSFHL
ncbi:MAG: DUF5916 domain-containing protein [Bacteroidia bacterium]|nr:DUF5916 domain-containing protein [Bacteroidia bacterium]